MHRLLLLATLAAFILYSPLLLHAQNVPAEQNAAQPGATETPAAAEAAAEQPAPDGEAAERFAEQYREWQRLLEQLRVLQTQYQTAPASEAPAIRQKWTELIQQGEKMIPDLREAALEAYRAAPNQDRQLTRFLARMAQDAVSRDQYEIAYEIGQLLLENGAEIKELYDTTGRAAFAIHEFGKAEEYLRQAQIAGVLSDESQRLGPSVKQYQQLWEEEQKLREQDAQANLPRVRLQTSKGDIVLELFEDQAPETVGNFVSLVENGFYDGTTFHRVLPGFMAQTGDPSGDGSGGPGYTIYDETDKPDARKHFRGSLSMANTGRPNSGGSQYFITFLPTPHLNGRHTVFGRVLEGMDVLAKLQRRDPSASPPLPEPDKVVKAEVIRKRDHAYVPHKLQ